MPLMLDITYLARHCPRNTYASNAERHLPMHRRSIGFIEPILPTLCTDASNAEQHLPRRIIGF